MRKTSLSVGTGNAGSLVSARRRTESVHSWASYACRSVLFSFTRSSVWHCPLANIKSTFQLIVCDLCAVNLSLSSHSTLQMVTCNKPRIHCRCVGPPSAHPLGHQCQAYPALLCLFNQLSVATLASHSTFPSPAPKSEPKQQQTVPQECAVWW